jgi:hypothetical protein
MTLFAAGITGMGLASRRSGNPVAMLATEGVGEGAKMLQDRSAAAEAAMGGQKLQASTSSDGPPSARPVSRASSPSGSGKAGPISWYGRRSRSGARRAAAIKQVLRLRLAVPVARSRLAAAEKKRYERRRQEQERERFEATADRLSGELRSLPSGIEKGLALQELAAEHAERERVV